MLGAPADDSQPGPVDAVLSQPLGDRLSALLGELAVVEALLLSRVVGVPLDPELGDLGVILHDLGKLREHLLGLVIENDLRAARLVFDVTGHVDLRRALHLNALELHDLLLRRRWWWRGLGGGACGRGGRRWRRVARGGGPCPPPWPLIPLGTPPREA